MSDPADSVEALLEALRAETSLPGRVRLLAQSWKLVRGLGPTDRHRLALALGSKWAWKHLERTFAADGELSEGEMLVKRALRQVGESDPSDVRETVRLVRSGQHKEAGSRFLQLLEAAVVLPSHGEEGLATPALDADSEPAIDAAAPEGEAALADDAQRDTGAGRETEPERYIEAQAGPEADAEPPAGDVPTGPAERATPVETDPVEESLEKDTRQRSDRRQAPPVPEPEVVDDEDTGSADGFDPGVVLSTAGVGGVAALRLLRQLDERGVQIARDPEQRRALIAHAGSGWAARRALTQMIQRGILTDVDEALSLIAGIESPAQQTWALADLIAYVDLDELDVERVLEAAPTDAARRRLARRAAR